MNKPLPFPGPQKQPVNIDISQTVRANCKCGCNVFTQVFNVRILSKMAPGNPYGKRFTIAVQLWQCVACKTTYTPDEIGQEKIMKKH